MDETQVILRGQRRWSIRPAAAEPLLADDWPPDHPDRLDLVKRGNRRAVFRFETAGQGYYVKVCEAADPLRRLRARLGMGPGRREWDALRAARAAGLDVPEPVALALGPQETLVTREIPGGRRLDEYLFERYFEAGPADPPYPGARPPELVAVFRTRRGETPADTIDPPALARALAQIIRRLTEADLYLGDLHPGNLLISGSAGQWRLSLVDLAEATRPAPAEAVLKHLVQLEHFFEPIASAAERVRCLARLRELAVDVPPAPVIARATAVYRQRFYPGRDRRTRRESKYFRRIRVGPWRGWAAADWADAVAALLAAAGDGDPVASADATALKQGRTNAVWRVRLADGRSLIAKRHHRAGDRGRVYGALEPSRSTTAFRRGHELLVRGIATARPAAAVNRRGPGADTLLLTEPVEDAQPLHEWLRGRPSPAARRHVTWQLARMLRRMHHAGLAHRDLKAPNVLVAPVHGPRPGCVLVDLDGLRQVRRLSVRRRAQNLMRLSVSLDEWGVARQTDRLRFLRIYLWPRGCPRPMTVLARRRGGPDAAERLRRWWRRIARASARKIEALRGRRPELQWP